jgi:hypothetical protein
MKNVLTVVVAVAFLSTTGAAALAQQGRAELRGSVVDQQGAALPGVTILITNQDTGTFREVISTGDGGYFAGQMLPGVFTITAQLPGFSTFEQTDFAIGVGRTLDLDIVMQIGALEETVTVTGEVPLVDLSSAEVGGTINTSDLTDLPTGNRSYFAAIALLPGVQFRPSTSLGNDTIIVNGQHPNTNNVALDGAANNDDNSGTWAGGQTRVPLESVQEFQVITNQFDAEFGRAAGAVINSITKQGTNTFTGAAFDYYTSEQLTSPNYFEAANENFEKAPSSKMEWGGVIGGPIVPDRAHFFFSLERQVVAPSRPKVFPSRPDLDFTTVESWEAWNTLIRFDHQVNASNSWAFRWLRELAPQFDLLGGRQATLNSLEDETDNDQTYVGSWTSVIGSDKVNTVRVSATREQYWRGNPCWRDLGGFSAPADQFGTLQSGCRVQYNFDTFTDNQLSSARGNTDNHWSYSDTFSWFVPDTMGDHDLKFGTTLHNTWMNWRNQSTQNGQFNFNTDRVFDPDDFSTWPERLYIRSGGQLEVPHRFYTLEAYAQDKWSVNDRLTLSLGARYDLEVFPLENPNNPFFVGMDRAYPIDGNNFAPRTSFAYDLAGDGRSVLRGGYGIFYDKTLGYAVNNYRQNTPYISSFTAPFPQDTADPGPSNGMAPGGDLFRLIEVTPGSCPANPNGSACPNVNRQVLNELFPAGSRQLNSGSIEYDNPYREQPYSHQLTIGYERELTPVLSASVDYVRQLDRDTHMRQNLNPRLRTGTGRTDPITRSDAFGVLAGTLDGDDWYAGDVRFTTSNGSGTYNALNFQVEKRYADNWGFRAVYALAKKETNSLWFTYTNFCQVGAMLNVDCLWGPSQYDRRHNFTLSGRTEIPVLGGITFSSVLRYMSGQPFHLQDSNFDLDQNGIGPDFLPAGNYSGTGQDAISVAYAGGPYGAYGPDFLQLDVRFGHRTRWADRQTLDIFFDIFNITNRANFNNPSGDMRGNFLVLTGLRAGSGFPRQAQFGIRWGF